MIKKINILAALVHGSLFIGFLLFFKNKLDPSKERIDLYRLGIDDSAAFLNSSSSNSSSKNEINFPQKAVKSKKINIRKTILAFFLITAAVHTLYATDFFGAGFYSQSLTQGWNPYRWIEYGITASLMVSVIAPLSGMREVNSVALVVASTAALQGVGYIVEKSLKAGSDFNFNSVIASTLIGWGLLISSWKVILGSFFAALKDAKKIEVAPGKFVEIPKWIWAIGIVQMIFFASFGLIQLHQCIQMSKNNSTEFNFLNTEQSYILLSLFSKATLASVLAYGLVGRNSDKVKKTTLDN